MLCLCGKSGNPHFYKLPAHGPVSAMLTAAIDGGARVNPSA
jgi:hypothetical protein